MALLFKSSCISYNATNSFSCLCVPYCTPPVYKTGRVSERAEFEGFCFTECHRRSRILRILQRTETFGGGLFKDAHNPTLTTLGHLKIQRHRLENDHIKPKIKNYYNWTRGRWYISLNIWKRMGLAEEHRLLVIHTAVHDTLCELWARLQACPESRNWRFL